jgi:catechol 2,3-dioxygenase-like lactoylglutathione lyase family enzyme
MAKVSVRYIVDDVDAAIDFYCGELGFHEDMHPLPVSPWSPTATYGWF